MQKDKRRLDIPGGCDSLEQLECALTAGTIHFCKLASGEGKGKRTCVARMPSGLQSLKNTQFSL